MSIFRPGLLKGDVAFVTGGGSGIGLGIAKRLAEQGANVVVLGRSAEKLAAAAAELARIHEGVLTVAADVRDYAALEAAMARTVERFGRLDILVNSAAGNFLAPAAGLSANGFRTVIDIDLNGTFNACRAAFAHLSVRGGAIVSITATQAWVPTPLQCHAGAAKAGIAKLTQDLALEWGRSKVRVNALAPGPIAGTEGMRRLAPTDDASRDQFAGALPLGRWGTIDEIADAALFLLSPAAAFITGTTLVVDGGQSLIGSARMLDLMQF